ncbi:acyl-CoA thioesterase [Oceanicoccus sagamiensis]|uniref:Acyl-CoA thioesterase 2 n=1 Tax=Oceanicoccus sagamiensis TaxID=716816 RepID=A0A1X9N4J7_9GAMM|nr:acyl-CoA thioesterase II [Oceanicoccus sagamiensis]ARN72676.1 acyl-CoA thioesterase II [Oceanicoccus sagamiensis]
MNNHSPELLAQLLEHLQIEQLDAYLFRGASPKQDWPRVFGGQVLAQAMYAASTTVSEERQVHSLHGYFLRAGKPDIPIIYEVDPIRDGGSFTTRRVVAIQEGKAIFNSSMSFQKPEQGLEHQFDMPDVVGPEGLQSDADYWEEVNKAHPGKFFSRPPLFRAIDFRLIQRRDLFKPEAMAPEQGVWFKTNATMPDDPAAHHVMLSYISDMHFMSTSLMPHTIALPGGKVQGASLDHAMWFHDDFRVDEWMYYHMDSPRSSGGRGINRGSIYTQDGRLVVSTAQEGLIRVRK